MKPENRVSRARQRRTGFSFTEVLFAIMILGIGFIMIAAIFPAALTQTRLTGEEANAAVMARASVNYIENVFQRPTGQPVGSTQILIVPPTAFAGITPPAVATAYPFTEPGRVLSFRDGRLTLASGVGANVVPLSFDQGERLWEAMRQNQILASDPRLAWVPMFRRDRVIATMGGVPQDSSYAQIIIIAAEIRNRTQYDPVRDTRRGAGDSATWPANLEPAAVGVTIQNSTPPSPDQIVFNDRLGLLRAAPGAFVVISDDGGPSGGPVGAMNGRIFRLGNLVEGATDTYELAPGGDIPFNEPTLPATNATRTMVAMILGRGYADPDNPTQGGSDPVFEGPAQDVSIYTTFVRVPGN